MYPKLRDSVISNPFEYVFFRFNQSYLRDEDRIVLECAKKDAFERFKCKPGDSLLVVSEAYVDRYGTMPSWSYKWFENLGHKLKDRDMKNYLKAVTTRGD